jgi:uncharacterized protein (TIGR04255 family)
VEALTPHPAQKFVDFVAPPVAEVVLSAQFAAPIVDISVLAGFTTAVRRSAPTISHQPVLPRIEETFDRPTMTPPFQFIAQQPGLPRTWFSGIPNYLIQLQGDRITLNWRRSTIEEKYPGYVRVRQRFDRHLKQLAAAVARTGRELPPIDMCEVAYVNPVGVPGEHPEFRHPDLGEVINRIEAAPEGAFLPQPEDAQYQARWRIDHPRGSERPVGRLYLAAVPHLAPNPLYMITLTAHVRPVPEETGFDALNKAHEYVVLGFEDLTTEKMQKHWRKKKVV